MKSDFLLMFFFCFLIATLGIRIFLTVIKGGRVYLFLSIYNCNNALIYFGSDILDLKTNMRSPSRYCTIISGGVITWLMVGLTYGLFLGCSSSGWPACKFCCLNKSYFHFALIKSTWSNLQKSELSPRKSLLNTLESKINLDLGLLIFGISSRVMVLLHCSTLIKSNGVRIDGFYIQILCRFQTCKRKVHPPSLLKKGNFFSKSLLGDQWKHLREYIFF